MLGQQVRVPQLLVA